MSLSELASLGSFVGGVAVVISFVFLGLQMRQADKSQKALLVSQTGSLVNECLLKMTEPHLADLSRRMNAGESDFTETEIHQLLLMLTANLNCLEDIFVRHDLSLSDKGSVESATNVITSIFSAAVPRALWPFLQGNFSLSFRARVDEIIRNTTTAPKPPSLAPILRASLARQS